jgi:hypothetical protein
MLVPLPSAPSRNSMRADPSNPLLTVRFHPSPEMSPSLDAMQKTDEAGIGFFCGGRDRFAVMRTTIARLVERA